MASPNDEELEATYAILNSTRPTAVNLKFGLDAVAPHYSDPDTALEAARAHDDAEVEAAEMIGEHGQALISDGATVSTHCNAGWLAAQDWGTALSPVYKAVEAGNAVTVIVDETRPRLQGSRLTAWELAQNGIQHRVVADGATASLLRRGEIDIVITGADRIAANGDAANKIGTYPLALAAQAAGVPFYIAAPTSTIDPSVASGDAIPIEERNGDEVLYVEGLTDEGELSRVRVAPQESEAVNPAFDVTPAALITGLITNAGIVEASVGGVRSALRK
jgi:S-methyl-5-thioribose-1-phosphate isomerase